MHLLVRHEVVDFVRWREVFETHREAQEAAGMELLHLWRNVDEPNEVVLLYEVEDPEKAKDFVYSSEVPDAQNASGIIDEPDIYFLE